MCRTVNVAFVFFFFNKKSIFLNSLSLLLRYMVIFIKLNYSCRWHLERSFLIRSFFTVYLFWKMRMYRNTFDILKRAADVFEKFAVLWQHKRIVSNSSIGLNGRRCIRGGHHSWSSLQIRWGLISGIHICNADWSLLQIWCWLILISSTVYRFDAGLSPFQIRCCLISAPYLILSSLRYIIDSMLANLCSDSMLKNTGWPK